MDLQTLSNLFATTYNPDPNVRRAAELEIRRIGNEEGMITALLQIIAADNVDIATRQACAVWVKNRVYQKYEAQPPRRQEDVPTSIHVSDKAALRQHILSLIAASPSSSISLQLASVLKTMISADLPASADIKPPTVDIAKGNWPTLLGEVKRLLVSGDIREVRAGCIASLEAVRAFRYRNKNDLMPQIVSELFPSLVGIATNMLQQFTSTPTAAQDIPTLLHIILKAYRTSIVVSLSPHQQSSESLVPWGQLLFAVVNLQIPKEAEAAGDDEDERERSEWWKAKKWAYGTLGRLFHRFGNPSQLPSAHKVEYGAFAEHFVTMFAPEILGTYLRQVELYVSAQTWLSKKCQYHIFTFFAECVKPKSTWTLLQPHFETLLQKFIFPKMSFNEEKQEVFTNDPVEYVRISVDEYETFATPIAASTSLLLSVASNRTKSSFMGILGFINSVLRSNAAPAQRFGALAMTSALGHSIMQHPDVSSNMEAFVLQFITPSLPSSSEPAWLRAQACEVLGTLTKFGLKWSSKENLEANLRGVFAGLDDESFVVRVHSALALTEMVQSDENVQQIVGQQVGKVVQDLLKLSDEMDLNILNRSMEIMVERYETQLLPVAAELTARLCESYMRLARDTVASEESEANVDFESSMSLSGGDDDDKVYAAMGVGKTIWTILSSLDGSPEILLQVQEIIIPIIKYTLEHKLLDLFDTMYELVDSLTFKTHAISPNMWPIFELTYSLFKSDAIDFLDEMLPAIDNFISYGGTVISTRPDYKQMLVDIYTTSMTSEQLGDNDRINGSKVAESILLNLRGHMDDYLQTIILTALEKIDKANTFAFRLANMEVLINSVLYNPTAALHLMGGSARPFFDRWFKDINNAEEKLPRVHDKKLSIMALSALLEVNPAAVPDALKEGWHGIVGGILNIFKDLPKAIELRKKLEAFDDEDDEDELVEEPVLNLEDDGGDVWDEDSAYLDMLASEGQRLREKSANADAGIDTDEESDDDEVDEELGYISPLETVNPYVTFKRALTTFQAQNGPAYQASTTILSVEQQTLLMELMRKAEEAELGVATA